jgi:transposase
VVDADLLHKFEISEEDLKKIPPKVLALVAALVEETATLRKRIEELESRLNRNSSNSNQPPSDDKPFKKKPSGEEKGKAGGKKGHKGHRQVLLEPTETKELRPETCSSCGSTDFTALTPYYTHQWIELPEIKPDVLHFILYRGECVCCGKVNKAVIPQEHRTGYGPHLSAVMAEMAGNQADSRSTVQNFCSSVLGFHISLGAIQKVIDRVSAAILPHYDAIADRAREAEVNNIDETSWFRSGIVSWLWVMASSTVAFFMIHSRRNMEAFKSLVKDWEGILVSDGYGVYRKWVGLRQTCLAHLIREARALSQKKDPEIARFGKWAMSELQRLCHMAHETPTIGEWRAFYARFLHLIARNHERHDAAGVFARRLERELDHLWVFLVEHGVSCTNNHAERMLRYAVLWRKRSQGTASEKGDRWVERILSLRQTCRLHSKSTFHVLVDAVRSHFKGQEPDLSWITQA